MENENLKTVNALLSATATAFKNFKENYSADKTSDELFSAFKKSLDLTFKDYEIKYDFLVGNDTLNVDGITENYIPKAGDTVIMDISLKINGAWSDVCRTFFIGSPTRSQKKAFNLVKKSIKKGEKVLRAGIPACDIYSAVNSVYEKNGEKLIHHAGHKIGSEPLEQPQFLSENKTPVNSGEIFTIESGLYKDFGIRLENDYLIAEKKAINLFIGLMPLNIKEYILK